MKQAIANIKSIGENYKARTCPSTAKKSGCRQDMVIEIIHDFQKVFSRCISATRIFAAAAENTPR